MRSVDVSRRARAAEPQHVVVRFDAAIGRYAAELLGADAKCDERAPDGGCVAEFAVTRTEAFFRWLLKFGPRAEITAPEAMRRGFADYVRAVLNQYAWETADAARR